MRTCILASSVIAILAIGTLQADNPADFVVPSATDDSKFQLTENRGKTVVLHFLLKTECPYCLRYTHEYAKLVTKSRDVVHVFLKPDSEKDIKRWASQLDKKDLQDLPKNLP